MDRAAQRARTLSVNDPDFEDTLFETRFDVIGNQLFDVTRMERVEIERTVDRQLYGVVSRKLIFVVVRHTLTAGNDAPHSFDRIRIA